MTDHLHAMEIIPSSSDQSPKLSKTTPEHHTAQHVNSNTDTSA